MNNQKKPEEISIDANKGVLFLVPAPLDFGCNELVPLQNVLPEHTIQTVSCIKYWICENAKSTRAYLNRVHPLYPLKTSLQDQVITELPRAIHKHGDHGGSQSLTWDARSILQPALNGFNIGLVSEAGMPAIADPGSSVVKTAHKLGIRVQPLVGPVSLLLALAASGLNGQNFAFVGYLPQAPALRKSRIIELEGIATKYQQTQIFIETPYRNEHLLRSLIETLNPTTYLSVASGLTLNTADIWTQSIRDWKAKKQSISPRTPTVFAIGM
jgi:16S rRNA (cytidine1402-2'-O)-methyltransferase